MSEEFTTIEAAFDEESGVGRLTLNRPDSLNAFNGQLREEIVDGLRWLEAHDGDVDGVALRAVIIEGAGGNFSAGADVNEFEESSPAPSSERHYRTFMLDFPAPIVAKIRGYCLGGGFETAMACDFRFAHEDSQLGLPEVDLGITPGDGVQFVSRLANPSIAKELAMTGERIGAERAAEIGLVNRVYGGDLDEATREFAETIASKPPLSVRTIKESADAAVETGLREGRRYDRKLGEPLKGTEDHEKATRAFAEDDYEPTFEGR